MSYLFTIVYRIFFSVALSNSTTVFLLEEPPHTSSRAQIEETSNLSDSLHVPSTVVFRPDLIYSKRGGRELKLDLFLPKSDTGPFPAVIFIHGERPQNRGKEHFRQVAAHLAHRGFVTATIDYRGLWEAGYPAAIEDALASVAWMKTNAEKYRIRPYAIGAVGESFGGYVAAMLGASRDQQKPTVQAVATIDAITNPRTFTSEYPYEFALFLGYPPAQRPDLWKEASPIDNVNAQTAPLMVMYSPRAQRVPPEQSINMVKALEAVGVQTETWSPAQAEETFFESPDRAPRIAMRIAGFFGKTIWSPPEGVRMIKDIVYASPGGRQLRLDLFVPQSEQRALPGIIFIHGGGWAWGDKTVHRYFASYLATKGFVTACIEYRLSRERVYPAAVDDGKAAVRWMRANGDKYGINIDKIGVSGSSAGGHLAALLGVTPDKNFFENRLDNAGVSARIQAVVALSAPTDLIVLSETDLFSPGIFLGGLPQQIPQLWREASPIEHVTSQSAPMLFMHGSADGLVVIDPVRAMVNKLKAAGVEAELFVAEGGTHDFFFAEAWQDTTKARMIEFFARTLK